MADLRAPGMRFSHHVRTRGRRTFDMGQDNTENALRYWKPRILLDSRCAKQPFSLLAGDHAARYQGEDRADLRGRRRFRSTVRAKAVAMIRRALIVFCVLSAAAIVGIGVVSWFHPLHLDFSRPPEFSVSPMPLATFSSRLAGAEQWWRSVVVADFHVTVSYCGSYEPPFALVRVRGAGAGMFENNYRMARTNLMMTASPWPAETRVWTEAATYSEAYRGGLRKLERAAAIQLGVVAGDDSFIFEHTAIPQPQYLLRVPLWGPVALLAAYPVLWLLFGPIRRRRRRRRGQCVRCGYDLTGNMSGTCPECGVARGE